MSKEKSVYINLNDSYNELPRKKIKQTDKKNTLNDVQIKKLKVFLSDLSDEYYHYDDSDNEDNEDNDYDINDNKDEKNNLEKEIENIKKEIKKYKDSITKCETTLEIKTRKLNDILKLINKTKNTKSISIIELNKLLFTPNSINFNNNKIKNAWNTLKDYIIPNNDKLIIINSHPGHFVSQGWCTGSIRNPHWLVQDENNNQYYIMNCGENNYTYFSKEDYKDIINPSDNIYPTWTKAQNGYVDTHSYITTGNRIYLHQLVCKKYNEKAYATLSVDHINRNKLDNRKDNLRFATQSQQNQNTDKRNRKKDAKPLPEGLKQEDMPKYVLFYSEKYGKDKNNPHYRYWFNIEKHPKQNGKKWSTSKAGSLTIQEKLDLAKEKLNELNNLF